MPELSHYPTAIAVRGAFRRKGGALPIAQAAQRVNELDSQLMAVQQQIDRFEGNADRAAAFDMDFKNDAQRKARRFEVLLVNQQYQQAIDTQMRLSAEKANAIAHQLTDLESRELVGL